MACPVADPSSAQGAIDAFRAHPIPEILAALDTAIATAVGDGWVAGRDYATRLLSAESRGGSLRGRPVADRADIDDIARNAWAAALRDVADDLECGNGGNRYQIAGLRHEAAQVEMGQETPAGLLDVVRGFPADDEEASRG